jgi:hypothetical protein
MNTQNINLFGGISKAEKKQLVTVVNETIAFATNQQKTFTAAELWNIQRQKKSLLQRRHA